MSSSTAEVLEIHAHERVSIEDDGDLRSSGIATFDAGLNLANGVLRTAQATIGGTSTFSSGSVSAVEMTVLDTLVLAGTETKTLINTVVNNQGTIQHLAGEVVIGGGGVRGINNRAGALYELAGDVSFGGSSLDFTNEGTLLKSAGTGTVDLGPINLNNQDGRIEVRAGHLQLRGGEGEDGHLEVQAGTTLSLTGATGSPMTLSGNFTGSGQGQVLMPAGRMQINDPGLTLDLPDGMFLWQGGTLAGSRLNNPSLITLSGPDAKILSNTLIENTGTVRHLEGELVISGGGIRGVNNRDAALYELGGDVSFGGGGDFNNEGVLLKSGGSGTVDMESIALNNAGGRIEVVSGRLQLRGGVGSGGHFEVSSGATLDLTGATGAPMTMSGIYTGSGLGQVRMPGGRLQIASAGLTFNFPDGLFHWQGGTMAGSQLINRAFLTLSGPDSKTLSNTVIENQGTVRHTGGELTLAGGGFRGVNNRAGALYELQGDLSFGGGGAFNNEGRLEKSVGSGTADLDTVDFNNLGGRIEVDSGRLQLRGGEGTGGHFDVGDGATLFLTGDTGPPMVLSGTFTGSGQGQIRLSGGRINIDDPGLIFDFPDGQFFWQGGTFANSVLTNQSFITLDGPDAKTLINTVIENRGTVHHAEGDLVLAGGGFRGIDNRADALYDFGSEAGFSGSGDVNNEGIWRKSSGSGPFSLGFVRLNNIDGRVEILSGQFLWERGSSDGGFLLVNSGARLDLSGSSSTSLIFSGVFSGEGEGLIRIAGPFRGSDTDPVSMDFPDGLLEWDSGEIRGTVANRGTLTLTGAEPKRIAARFTNTGSLIVAGEGDVEVQTIAEVENAGSFEFQSDADLTVVGARAFGPLEFLNLGTFSKTAGGGETLLHDPQDLANFVFTNRGLLDVRSGSLTLMESIGPLDAEVLSDGAWSATEATLNLPADVNITGSEATITLAGSSAMLTGISNLRSSSGLLLLRDGASFTTASDFANSGAIVLGAGSQFGVAGAYASEGGSIAVTVGGRPQTGQFGRLVVTGDAQLDGSLFVSLEDGFTPVLDDSYQVVGASMLNGSRFDEVLGAEPVFSSAYDDANLFLFAGDVPLVDLVPSGITAPPVALAGSEVQVQWTVTNQGSDVARGPWFEALSVQRMIPIDGTDPIEWISSGEPMPVAEVSVPSDLMLAPGQSTQLSADLTVPGAELGDYRWAVFSNRRADVFETEGRANNEFEAAEVFTLDVPELLVGAAPQSDQFPARSSPRWFRVSSPVGRDVQITLELENDGVTELYLGADRMPGRFDFDHRHEPLGAADVSVASSQRTDPDIYYVYAFPAVLAAEPGDFTISAALAPIRIDTVFPEVVGNVGSATLLIRGDQLSEALAFRLRRGGTQISAQALRRTNSGDVYATFELNGTPLGAYDLVVVENSTEAASLPDAVTMEAARSPDIAVSLLAPSVMRSGRQARLTLSYQNLSNVDARLPYVAVGTSAGSLQLRRESTDTRRDWDLVPPPVLAGSAVMPPGSRGEMPLYFNAPLETMGVTLSAWADSPSSPVFGGSSFDWDVIEQETLPAGVDAGLWAARIAGERARVGETFAELFDLVAAEYITLDGEGYDNLVFAEGQVLFQPPPLAPGGPEFRGVLGEDSGPVGKSETEEETKKGPQLHQPAGNSGNPQDLHGVFVGSGDYSGSGGFGSLPGAQKDAADLFNYFDTGLNKPEGWTTQLVGDTDGTQVSRKRFFDAIDAAIAEADGNDTVFVHLASHGICDRDDPKGAIVLSSGEKVHGDELNRRFGGTDATVVFLADTCRSASYTEQITASNVVNITSTDYFESAVDANSTSQIFLSELQAMGSEPDLIMAARGALTKKWLERAADIPFSEGEFQSGRQELRYYLDYYRKENPGDPGSTTAPPLERVPSSKFTTLSGDSDFARASRLKQRQHLQLGMIDSRGRDSIPIEVNEAKAGASSQVGEKQQTDSEEPDTERGVDVRASYDPNEKVGILGADGFVHGDVVLPYTIFFENDPNLATLPAQFVTITDVLDEDLDLATFELTEIAVGSEVVPVPPGLYAYETTISLRAQDNEVDARVAVELDFQSRTVTWSFSSIDPATGQPTEDDLAGFLPVNDVLRRGEGFVSYQVLSLAGLATGVEIVNSANIVFDDNPPIITNETQHRLDVDPPTSTVAPLPARSLVGMQISWAGSDGAGSGVAHYDVYVSIDGEPFVPWLLSTTRTEAALPQFDGTLIGLYSVATDRVGHRQQRPPQAQALTELLSARVFADGFE
ncbi:MAG: hypothetical protein AAF358_12110 [Pseudomonadota bacterium]